MGWVRIWIVREENKSNKLLEELLYWMIGVRKENCLIWSGRKDML